MNVLTTCEIYHCFHREAKNESERYYYKWVNACDNFHYGVKWLSGEWLKLSDAWGNQEVYTKLINDQEWNGSCAGSTPNNMLTFGGYATFLPVQC